MRSETVPHDRKKLIAALTVVVAFVILVAVGPTLAAKSPIGPYEYSADNLGSRDEVYTSFSRSLGPLYSVAYIDTAGSDAFSNVDLYSYRIHFDEMSDDFGTLVMSGKEDQIVAVQLSIPVRDEYTNQIKAHMTTAFFTATVPEWDVQEFEYAMKKWGASQGDDVTLREGEKEIKFSATDLGSSWEERQFTVTV